MPRNLMFLEDDARKAIAEKLARGHVDVFMTYRNLRSDARTVQVDTRAVRRVCSGAGYPCQSADCATTAR